MKDLSNIVLEQIKKENVKPVPKWQFVLKRSFVWILFGINLVLGVIGTAIVIFLIANNDAVSDISLSTNVLERLILVIPILWILLTGIFVFVAYYNFKHTEGGYRYTTIGIVSLNILVTLILGYTVYVTGGADRINSFFSANIPYYSSTLDTRAMVWMRPEEGYLSGDIQKVEGDKLELLDLDGNIWIVDFTGADVKHMVVLEDGERIKLIGEATSDKTFVASEIRPWSGIGRGMQEN